MIDLIKNEKSSVLKLDVPLDSKVSPVFEEKVNDMISSGERVVVADFSESSFISSSGIGSLLFAHKKLSSLGGRLFIYNLNSEITEILKVIGVYNSLFVISSLTQAENSPFSFESKSASAKNESYQISAIDDKSLDSYVEMPSFPEPLVVECASCSSFTRVHRPGDYICPSCHTEFSVEGDGTVIF
ncbi:MAG TPA: STAS domain-containing protein [Spirochaetota bacterium]|nr:STAS domain-containing protein [Spirochaetota bacterium]HQE58390.1 STAS domain-containing protein [Spirochaetota bacterium]